MKPQQQHKLNSKAVNLNEEIIAVSDTVNSFIKPTEAIHRNCLGISVFSDTFNTLSLRTFEFFFCYEVHHFQHFVIKRY